MSDLIVVKDGELAFNYNGENPELMRERILQFKDALMALPSDEKVEFPVEHVFVDGMYMRKMFAPKGQIVVGKIHKKPCINFVEYGDISVLTESGFARVKAGFTLVSPAGIMKVGIAHEDTMFINVFRTDKTTIEEVEQEIACEDYAELALEYIGETP